MPTQPNYTQGQSRAREYARMIMDMSQQPNQAGFVGGLSNAAQMMLAAKMLKDSDTKAETRDNAKAKAYADLLSDVGDSSAMVNEIPQEMIQRDAFNASAPMSEFNAGPDTRAPTLPEAITRTGNSDLAAELAPTVLKSQIDAAQAEATRKAEIDAAWQKPHNAAPGATVLRNGEPVYTAPAAPRAPTVAGGTWINPETNKWEPIPGYAEQQGAIADERRPIVNVNSPGGTETWAQPVTETGPDGKPQRVRYGSHGGRMVVPDAGPAIAPKKPLPASLQKLESEDIGAAQSAYSVNADLAQIGTQIDDGKLDLGLINNATNSVRNALGRSTEQSRNYDSFKATLERLRNESLRLNKGVQTEGDSVRAWNEIMRNITDEQLVRERLEEVKVLNDRAAQHRLTQAQIRRSNYGYEPLDEGQLQGQPAAIGAQPGAAPPQSQAPAQSAQSAPVRISGDDDFNRLPKGARFIGPDGVERVKP